MTEPSQNDSRTSILEEIRRRGDVTIDEVVESVGLSKTAARAHILRMERDNIVARVDAEIEGRGRPAATFALTEHGATLFPSSDSALLTRLLRYLKQHDGEAFVTGFFEELWADRMADLLEIIDETSTLEERLNAVEASLSAHHFMPTIERQSCADGSELVSVRECNCPFRTAADASRAPCRLEVDFLSRALGGAPNKISIATDRKGTCSFEFVVPK